MGDYSDQPAPVMPCLFRQGLQSYGTWAGIMEIVQTNGSEFDQWGIAEQIWMIMYELDLRDIEVCSYVKIIIKLLKK